MSRLLWAGVGAAAGVWAYRRVERVATTLHPNEIARRTRQVALYRVADLRDGVADFAADFVADIRVGASLGEHQRRDRLQAARAAQPRTQPAPTPAPLLPTGPSSGDGSWVREQNRLASPRQ